MSNNRINKDKKYNLSPSLDASTYKTLNQKPSLTPDRNKNEKRYLRISNESLKHPVQRAVEAFKSGDPVLIHDFDEREGETDLVFPAMTTGPKDIVRLRNDAGGLICVAVSNEVAESFDLPFLAEELDHPISENADIEYDSRSSFSLPVNHRSTHTGITDIDRSLTIRKLGEASDNPKNVDFINEFQAPGHVPILKAAEDLLDDRRGHTELGVQLAKLAEQPPAVVVCEMMDGQTGRELSKFKAKRYAQDHDLDYITGNQILDYIK